MEKWRKVEIEGLESVNHMLEALDIPHTLMNHDWVEVTGTSLHIRVDYDNWSDTVTLSIWDTDDNGDSRTIWGMTLPHESMDELLGHLHSALIPMMKQHGNGVKEEEDRTDPLSDGQENDREFVRSVFDDLTKRLRKECSNRGIGSWPERTVMDEPTIMVRDQRFYHGDPNRAVVLRFSWEKVYNTVTFSMMPTESGVVNDDHVVYTVDEFKGIDRSFLWNSALRMVLRNVGPVIIPV